MNIKAVIIIPIVFILILSVVLTNFLITFEEKVFIDQSKKIEDKIISEHKISIKNGINNIITILNQKSESFKNLQKEIIKERTNNAIQLIDNIYKENIHLKEEDIFIKIKQYLNFISSSDKSKYYYIYKMDGTCISVPANRKLEGKNLIELQDIKGQYVIKKVIDIASNGGGFNEWYYLNPKSNKIEKKIGYAVEYKPLNIFIGTAIYEQDIIDNIKQFSSHLLCDFKTSYGGYIFAYDDKGNTIAHIKKDLIGKNRWNLKKNGRYLLQELIKKGQQKDGSFLEYEATVNPKTKQPANKISFLNEFKKLKWVIGTGFYTDELYNDIKINQKKLKVEFDKELQNIILSAIMFTFVLVIILWFILSRISKKLIQYRKELEINNRKLNDLNINLEEKVNIKTKELQTNLNVITALLDSTIGGILISDENHKCIEINETALKMFKVKNKEEAMQKYIFNFVSSDSLPLMKEHMSDDNIEEYEVDLIRLDQEIFPALVKGKTIILDGKAVRVSAMVDLSDIKAKELLLLQHSKMAALGEMIGNIAHQWRQPLSVISIAASGMQIQKEHNILTDELFQESCSAINDNAQYLSKTIDDFKNFIKGDRTKKLFSLKDDIDSFLHLVEGAIKIHDINMILDIDTNIQIDGYENELLQCLINIFNNAKDILNEKVEENKLVLISTSIEEEKIVVIKIKDNGGGIPEDIINKVFEPYFTTKHQSQGTGLGLHMTYNLIVDGMGGTIEVQNVTYEYEDIEYTGAQFVISLPMS